MSVMVIACKTMEAEIRAAVEQTGRSYPILWLESGLHNVPKKLNRTLQDCLEKCAGADTVLLAMSFCGNSLIGLRTGDFQMIVPRCDDCITLLLGSVQRRTQLQGTYFLTEGWLKGERNLWWEYEACTRKYGEKRGKLIFSKMLAHYQSLALIDTKCYDLPASEREARAIAEKLGLAYHRIPGSVHWLVDLLEGVWPEAEFVRIAPNSVVSPWDCQMKET